MNIPPDTARDLSLWEYEALVSEHEMRTSKDGPPVDTPPPEVIQGWMDRLNNDRRFTH